MIVFILSVLLGAMAVITALSLKAYEAQRQIANELTAAIIKGIADGVQQFEEENDVKNVRTTD